MSGHSRLLQLDDVRTAAIRRRWHGGHHIQQLEIGRDMQRLDIDKLAELVAIAAGEEPHDGRLSAMRVFLLRTVATKNSKKAAGSGLRSVLFCYKSHCVTNYHQLGEG
jgi:hypothetical protein